VRTKLAGPTDYGALGYYVGAIVGGGVPVFEGMFKPNQEELIMLGSALATSGAVAMYHIPGITPEASTSAAAFDGNIPKEEIAVNEKEIHAVYNKLRTAKDTIIDFVYLGCPQYTVEQIRVVADLLDGRRVHENTVLWIGTHRMAFTMAERMGYYEIIKRAGGVLVCDTCPVDSFLRMDALKKSGITEPRFRTMLTDSPKQAHYARTVLGCEIILGRTDVCVEAAVNGK